MRRTATELPSPMRGFRWAYVCVAIDPDARCIYGRWVQVPAARGVGERDADRERP
jgi:hypothetical protein